RRVSRSELEPEDGRDDGEYTVSSDRHCAEPHAEVRQEEQCGGTGRRRDPRGRALHDPNASGKNRRPSSSTPSTPSGASDVSALAAIVYSRPCWSAATSFHAGFEVKSRSAAWSVDQRGTMITSGFSPRSTSSVTLSKPDNPNSAATFEPPAR